MSERRVMIRRQVGNDDTHMSIQPAHKAIETLRILHTYMGLALKRVMHDHHGGEQSRSEKDKEHQR